MCVAIILSDGLFNYQCPRVVFIVRLHSVIFHIVHVHTWSGVSCCQIYLTCWWFLAHWTWRHVFLTCYMLVAFGTSDMISCYWHVYHLWSGHDVLYRFRLFHCLHPLSPTAFSSKHISWYCFCHVNHTCWWTLVHLTWVRCPPPTWSSGCRPLVSSMFTCVINVSTTPIQHFHRGPPRSAPCPSPTYYYY